MKKPWLFFLLIVPLYLTWTFDHSLWNPDETRDAGIASEMHRTGEFAVPKLNGEPFLEKPPLYYWACNVVYKLTGVVNAGTTRLPAALFGVLGILFTFLIGRLLYSERVGLMAALMVATSVQYFRMSHFAMMDIPLAALIAGAMYFYLKDSCVLFSLFVVLAFYAKGFLGVLLPGLAVSVDMLMKQKFKNWLKVISIGAVLFVVLVTPWFWALWKQSGWDYIKVFVIDNHWKRFFSPTGDHTDHFWFFYFMSFPGDFLPWTLPFLGFLWDLLRQSGRSLFLEKKRFPMVWFFSLLAFFCLASSKRSIYLLPLFPAAALLSAVWIDERFGERATRFIYGFGAVLGLAAVVTSFTYVKKLDRDKTFVPFCEAVQRHVGEGSVIGFDLSEMERGVFNFYLKKTFQNIKTVSDLERQLSQTPSGPCGLIINRNRWDDVRPLLEGKKSMIYEYRPNKRTRSYLLYSCANEGAL